MTLRDQLRYDQIDDLIDRWHAGDGPDMTLRQFLNMTAEEYAAFVMHGVLPPSITAIS